MLVKIRGRMFLWRAVDDEGEAPGMPVQWRRNKHAAIEPLRTPVAAFQISYCLIRKVEFIW